MSAPSWSTSMTAGLSAIPYPFLEKIVFCGQQTRHQRGASQPSITRYIKTYKWQTKIRRD